MSASISPRVAALSGLLLVLPLLALSGCGGAKFASPVPVSGKVTVKGKPLSGGTIHFAPVDGKKTLPGFGAIQSDGSYTATTKVQKDGLIPGEFLVFFDPPEITEKKARPVMPIPGGYLSPDTSGLKLTIDSKGGKVDFDLK